MKVLVIAVHPDDETLGCGGTLFKHKANSDEIHWLIMTEARTENGFNEVFIENRNDQIKQIHDFYKFKSVHRAGFSAMSLDQYPKKDIVHKVGKIISKILPDILYIPFCGDVHSDHRVTFEAAYSCTKTFRYPFLKRILMMETLSETEVAPATLFHSFIPNVFVDISSFLDQKLEAMSIYASEVQGSPLPRSLESIKALARYRGITICSDAAESFCLLRDIR